MPRDDLLLHALPKSVLYKMLARKKSAYETFLGTRKPILISHPRNKDKFRFEAPLVYSGAKDDSDRKTATKIIPPLNTDISVDSLRKFDVSGPYGSLAATPFSEHHVANFSWHIATNADSPATIKKKFLITPIQNQHMCGSCWAMALASCISDCFVATGIIDWMPRISPTFLMMSVPVEAGNGRCNGGTPATVVSALESIFVSDNTCIDYSWCSNNPTCTSALAQNHLEENLGDALNRNIPPQPKSCYFTGKKLLYKIDPGSEAITIGDKYSADEFRHIVKDHILKYGPILTGFAVLRNFVDGAFTDPKVNEGIYFEKGTYADKRVTFSDYIVSENNLLGLHAVEVVGWGVANDVTYDTGMTGPVEYWWAKNSWGSDWGEMGGYFKIAMYPWNKFAQFGKPVTVSGTTVGGMIMMRCTTRPKTGQLSGINSADLDKINRIMPDDYYMLSPEDYGNGNDATVHGANGQPRASLNAVYLYLPVVIAGVVLIIALIVAALKKKLT